MSGTLRSPEASRSHRVGVGSASDAPLERPQPPSTTFQPGDLLASRFRVIRFLDHGGKGEVYEAEDLELRVRVALKTIRPEIADDERALLRFKREILLARKV